MLLPPEICLSLWLYSVSLFRPSEVSPKLVWIFTFCLSVITIECSPEVISLAYWELILIEICNAAGGIPCPENLYSNREFWIKEKLRQKIESKYLMTLAALISSDFLRKIFLCLTFLTSITDRLTLLDLNFYYYNCRDISNNYKGLFIGNVYLKGK